MHTTHAFLGTQFPQLPFPLLAVVSSSLFYFLLNSKPIIFGFQVLFQFPLKMFSKLSVISGVPIVAKQIKNLTAVSLRMGVQFLVKDPVLPQGVV